MLLGRLRERLGVLLGSPREHSESFEELRGGFWSGSDEKAKLFVFACCTKFRFVGPASLTVPHRRAPLGYVLWITVQDSLRTPLSSLQHS